MKTLQEKYNAVLEGSFPKSQFVRDAKMEVPRFISPYNGFEDTVQILKNKGMLVEAKAETPEYDKPAPGYPLEALERGVDYELEKMGLMSNETVSEEDYAKAKKKAEKNLEKDVNHYLHLLSGDSKKVDKHDREVEVDQKKLFKGTVDPKGGKAEGNTDTFNAMKKANLNEDTKKELAKLLKEGAVEDLAKKLGIPVDKLQASIDKIKKSEETATAAAAKAAKPTYSENINPAELKPGDDDPNETFGVITRVVKGKNGYEIYGKDGSEGYYYFVDFDGNEMDEDDFIEENKVAAEQMHIDDDEFESEMVQDRVKEIKPLFPEVDDEMLTSFVKMHRQDIRGKSDEEIKQEFSDFYHTNLEEVNTVDIKEAVKKVIKHVLKENHQSLDLEVARRIEGLLDQALKAKFLDAGKDLIEDLVKEDQFVKNDVVSHLANELNLHVPIRDLFKEGTLNERVGGLQEFINLIQDRAVDSEFSEEEEALEVIEAIADHYGIKIQIGGFVGENVNENQDAIKFAQFIHAHGLKDKQIKDEEYLKDLYDNYKESVKENINEADNKIDPKAMGNKLSDFLKANGFNNVVMIKGEERLLKGGYADIGKREDLAALSLIQPDKIMVVVPSKRSDLLTKELPAKLNLLTSKEAYKQDENGNYPAEQGEYIIQDFGSKQTAFTAELIKFDKSSIIKKQ